MIIKNTVIMKVGSLVMCIKPTVDLSVVKPCTEKPYTIRAIFGPYPDGGYSIYLDEIINDVGENGLELAYHMEHFREIEFPPLLMLEIEECLVGGYELV